MRYNQQLKNNINILSSDYVMMTVIGIQMVLKDRGYVVSLDELFDLLLKKGIIDYLYKNCDELSMQNNYEVVLVCINKLFFE